MTHPSQSESQQFSQRLRSILLDVGFPLSPTLVANEFNLRYWGSGITAHAARNWINGVSTPKPDKLRVLALWLQVKPQDLLFDPETQSDLELQPEPDVLTVNESEPSQTLSIVDHAMMRRYRSLTFEHRRMVREIVIALSLIKKPIQLNPMPTDEPPPEQPPE